MKVGIIGLGWLGLPLAKAFLAKGYEVIGSSRSDEKKSFIEKSGITFQKVDLNTFNEADTLFKTCDFGIITIPPSRDPFSSYKNTVMNAVSLFCEKTKIIFTSSTSVYSDSNKLCLENSKVLTDFNYTSQMFLTEKELQKELVVRICILRLAGLIGENRHPIYSLAGKENLPNPDSPINLVTGNDVIKIIQKIIELDLFPEIFNVCADLHVSRKQFYTNAANKLNLKAPDFSDTTTLFKLVSNEKVKKCLNFAFDNNF